MFSQHKQTNLTTNFSLHNKHKGFKFTKEDPKPKAQNA